jgi:hypothetical protein
VADGRFHFAFAIRVADATGQRDDAVVGEDIAVERVQGGVVDVGGEDTFPEIVEHDDLHAAAETTETLLVQLSPATGARGEGQQPDALATVAEGEDEQPGAAVLPRTGMAHHRAIAVVDLAFFARRRNDDRVRLGRRRPAQTAHEAAHAGVLAGEAVVVDEIAPDRHRLATPGDGELDQLAVRLAGTGGRRALRARRPRWGGRRARRRLRVGGHLFGRFWWVAPASGGPHRQPGGLEVGPSGLTPHAGRRLDAAQRPAQLPEGNDLLLLRVAQEIGHDGAGTTVPSAASTS